MSDNLKNIIFNISKEESEAIAGQKKDWNEDFFPTSPKAALQKVLIMIIATVVLCTIVYSTSEKESTDKAAPSSGQSEPASYFNTDE